MLIDKETSLSSVYIALKRFEGLGYKADTKKLGGIHIYNVPPFAGKGRGRNRLGGKRRGSVWRDEKLFCPLEGILRVRSFLIKNELIPADPNDVHDSTERAVEIRNARGTPFQLKAALDSLADLVCVAPVPHIKSEGRLNPEFVIFGVEEKGVRGDGGDDVSNVFVKSFVDQIRLPSAAGKGKMAIWKDGIVELTTLIRELLDELVVHVVAVLAEENARFAKMNALKEVFIPGCELLPGVPKFFVEPQLTRTCLLSCPGFVDDLLAVLVVRPCRLEVKLLGKGRTPHIDVLEDRPVVRSNDRQVTGRGVWECGAPRNGNNGSLQALFNQIGVMFLVRPGEGNASESQINHRSVVDKFLQGVMRCAVIGNSPKFLLLAGNAIKVTNDDPRDSDRARQVSNGGPVSTPLLGVRRTIGEGVKPEGRGFVLGLEEGMRLNKRVNFIGGGENGNVDLMSPGKPESTSVLLGGIDRVHVCHAQSVELVKGIGI
ncbi:hypothetical protein GIB67_006111 [Kingdonia uniflora]|uniref:Uncharacterized protein n=1 Tax=Kingdonia uniflora TaxID=39325 RepID=A0A7J7LPX9_9MAGN|nr:hypothetical protein GIB67_006111 [Kingdonia uniflora]